jgi:hypothetical protein
MVHFWIETATSSSSLDRPRRTLQAPLHSTGSSILHPAAKVGAPPPGTFSSGSDSFAPNLWTIGSIAQRSAPCPKRHRRSFLCSVLLLVTGPLAPVIRVSGRSFSFRPYARIIRLRAAPFPVRSAIAAAARAPARPRFPTFPDVRGHRCTKESRRAHARGDRSGRGDTTGHSSHATNNAGVEVTEIREERPHRNRDPHRRDAIG